MSPICWEKLPQIQVLDIDQSFSNTYVSISEVGFCISIESTDPTLRSCLRRCFRRGDYILSVNGRELRGATQAEVDRQVAAAPRGLVRLVATAVPPGASFVSRQHSGE